MCTFGDFSKFQPRIQLHVLGKHGLNQSFRVQWQDWPQKEHSSHGAEVLVVKPNKKMYTIAFENM